MLVTKNVHGYKATAIKINQKEKSKDFIISHAKVKKECTYIFRHKRATHSG